MENLKKELDKFIKVMDLLLKYYSKYKATINEDLIDKELKII